MSGAARPAELFFEVGRSQLNKKNEELCGDSIAVAESPESMVIVCSDGLGSGVKANILSSLTAKMAATMLQQGCSLDEVIETLAHTLPVCEVRHLAYSTFGILQIMRDGRTYLAEYDTPPTFYGRAGRLAGLPRTERTIGERIIREAFFELRPGDWVAMVSDGVLHAGIGGIWNLGWGADKVGRYLEMAATKGDEATVIATEITDLCSKLYNGEPGDDASVVIVKVRHPRDLVVLIGPPADRRDDPEVVRRLMSAPGKRAVCGGTTGNLVARELGRSIGVDLTSIDPKVPPTGIIDGIDLVSEGILTVSYAVEKLKSGVHLRDVAFRRDGASRLTALLLEADRVQIMVGRAMNPAHQSPGVPINLGLKNKVVEDLVRALAARKKTVRVEYY
ncbi:MAG: SpoIIE family protein phosphatase [Bacillota bacterium]